ncbi:MAG TPA: reverse transcriptase domain-containing protein, partial [Candidatus Babeliaceae bacterium]|nr:reverse transcriptase domain-containing protein [Candidatus Babeliaceae bacterium]
MIAYIDDEEESNDAAVGNALVSESSGDNNDDNSVWMLDSAASNHIAKSNKHYSSSNQIKPRPIRLGNKQVIYATMNGDIPVSTTVSKGGPGNETRSIKSTLHGVLYSDSIGYNLLSVSKILDHGNTVLFVKDTAIIKNKSGKVIGIGKRHRNNLFRIKLNYQAKNNDSKQSVTAAIAVEKEISNTDDASLWHNRMGHLNAAALKEFNKMVDGCSYSASNIAAFDSSQCMGCMRGKAHRTAIPKVATHRATRPLEVIHSDICGPFNVPSHGGFKYFVTFIDDYSRYSWVKLIKTKDAALECFKEYHRWAERQTGHVLKTLRSDRGGEYLSKDFLSYLQQNGIARQLTTAYTPQQNGVSERMNRTLLESARSMLFHAHLDSSFWGEAILTASYLRNRSPSNAVQSITPYEGFWGRRPKVDNIRVFGCVAWVHVPDEKRTKLEPKGLECIFVGYSDESKAYILWNHDTRKHVISRDVYFGNESVFTVGGRLQAASVNNMINHDVSIIDSVGSAYRSNSIDRQSTAELSNNLFDVLESEDDIEADANDDGNAAGAVNDSYYDNLVDNGDDDTNDVHNIEQNAEEKQSPLASGISESTAPLPSRISPRDHASTRSLKTARQSNNKQQGHTDDAIQNPVDNNTRVLRSSPVPVGAETRAQMNLSKVSFSDFVNMVNNGTLQSNQSNQANPSSDQDTEDEALISFGLAAVSSQTDPTTYHDAMSREDAEEWKRAAEEEMQSIKEAGTYTLVERPPGVNVIGNKWVFKKKLKADNSIERYKARLVGKGYNQKEGVDYFETFAPVAKLSSIRALLALATHHDLEIHQM